MVCMNPRFFFLILVSGISITSVLIPTCNAHVWISPMKMLAEETISMDEIVYVEKAISLRNDKNETVMVLLDASTIPVLFENETVTLQPYERKMIYPQVAIQKGNYTGKILVNVIGVNETQISGGSKVVTSLAITVIARGIVNTSSSSNLSKENNNRYSNEFLYMVTIIIIGLVSSSYLLYRKRNN